jgi:hypothetical protein
MKTFMAATVATAVLMQSVPAMAQPPDDKLVDCVFLDSQKMGQKYQEEHWQFDQFYNYVDPKTRPTSAPTALKEVACQEDRSHLLAVAGIGMVVFAAISLIGPSLAAHQDALDNSLYNHNSYSAPGDYGFMSGPLALLMIGGGVAMTFFGHQNVSSHRTVTVAVVPTAKGAKAQTTVSW